MYGERHCETDKQSDSNETVVLRWQASTTLSACSIGINRFNRNRFRLKRLRFPNITLFQPFSVATVPESLLRRLPSSLMPVEKVDQPNQPKTVVFPIEHEKTQPT